MKDFEQWTVMMSEMLRSCFWSTWIEDHALWLCCFVECTEKSMGNIRYSIQFLRFLSVWCGFRYSSWCTLWKFTIMEISHVLWPLTWLSCNRKEVKGVFCWWLLDESFCTSQKPRTSWSYAEYFREFEFFSNNAPPHAYPCMHACNKST